MAESLLFRFLEVAGMVTRTGVTVQRTLLNAIAGVAIMTLVACGNDGRPASPTAPSTATVAAVVVTGGSTAAASFQLTATARMSDGTARDVTGSAAWESSNPVIAAVSQHNPHPFLRPCR